MTAPRLRVAAAVILAVPIVLLLVLAAGEVAAGDVTGLQYLAQAVPLLALAVVTRRWPYVTGLALVTAGATLGLSFALLWHPEHLTAPEVALVEALLLAPPVLAGMLLVLAGRERQR